MKKSGACVNTETVKLAMKTYPTQCASSLGDSGQNPLCLFLANVNN